MKKELTNDEFLGVFYHFDKLEGDTYEFNDIIMRNVENMRKEVTVIRKSLKPLDNEKRQEGLNKKIKFDFIPITDQSIIPPKLKATKEQTYCINKYLRNIQI